jgi:protein TonB
MASPAEIAHTIPDTLPADFGEWDSGDSEATLPVSPAGSAAAPVFTAVPKPPAQSAEPKAGVASAVDVLRTESSPAPEALTANDEAFSQWLRSISTVVDKLPDITGSRQEANGAVAEVSLPLGTDAAKVNGILSPPFRSNSADMGRRERASKPWKMIAAFASGPILVLLVLIPLFYSGKLAMVERLVEPQLAAIDTQSKALKPSPSTPLTAGKLPATSETQQTANAQPATDKEESTPPEVQSKMMSDQLTAPARIPHGIRKETVAEAPPSSGFGAAGMESMGGSSAISGVFSGQARPKVKVEPPKVVTISAGVAVGLVTQKTTPVYPQIAKSARVSGTVTLQATISKTGTIENLHVVSGPAMLRQAALDSVRTWRYRPYRLNNEPVEVETTVNVIFSLGG